MRLTVLALLSLVLLTACGPQPPNAAQWDAMTTAASAGGTARGLAGRCGFDITDFDAAFDKAMARYALSDQQKAELTAIGQAAAAALAGDPLPAGHALCTDAARMRDAAMDVVLKL